MIAFQLYLQPTPEVLLINIIIYWNLIFTIKIIGWLMNIIDIRDGLSLGNY